MSRANSIMGPEVRSPDVEIPAGASLAVEIVLWRFYSGPFDPENNAPDLRIDVWNNGRLSERLTHGLDELSSWVPHTSQEHSGYFISSGEDYETIHTHVDTVNGGSFSIGVGPGRPFAQARVREIRLRWQPTR